MTARDGAPSRSRVVGNALADGLLMVVRPVISAEALTFLMSVFFLLGGLYQLVAAVWTHLPGWGWYAMNGVIAAVMGVLILARWPVSGLWVIGLFCRN